MGDFQDLRVWRKSHELTLDLYRVTASFPRYELFGLTSQLRRAAASVPANIAEGCGRGGDAELVRFLRIALGSANELQYHLILARDLGYLESATYDAMADRGLGVTSMLSNLIRSLQLSTADGRRQTADDKRKAVA